MSRFVHLYECRDIAPDFYDQAPQRFVFTRQIPTSATRLFEIFEDRDSWPVWATGITDVEWTTPKPFGVGTTRTVTFSGGMKVYEVFSAWETGKHMAFHFTGATQRVWHAFGERYVVKDAGEHCELTWTIAYEPRFVFKAIHALVRPIMKWWLGRLADNLVKYVEAEVSADADTNVTPRRPLRVVAPAG